MEQKLKNLAERLPETALTPERLLEAVEEEKNRSSIRYRRVLALAGCVMLLLLLGIGGVACAAEVKEYNEAIGFFDTYGLSADGLTRGEIKAVYRDITTSTFTYAKTAEVLEKTIVTNSVQGFELIQDNPTPDTVEKVWQELFYNGTYWVTDPEKQGIRYAYGSSYKKADDMQSLEVMEQSIVEKYDGGELVWSVPVKEFWITGCTEVSDGVIAYGETDICLNQTVNYGWLVKIDSDGNKQWIRRLEQGYGLIEVSAVLENGDGSYGVLARADLSTLYFCKYSAEGELLHTQYTSIDGYGIWNAARLGDGYLVQLGSYMDAAYAKLIRLDAMGNLTEGYSYEAEDIRYYITDMLEYKGKVYLSAYAVPLPEGKGSRSEIEDVLGYLFDNQIWQIDDAELTPMIQEIYTAVLLVCDPDGGAAQEFYQVKASLGGKLSVVGGGSLCWAVETITNTFYSPATSAYTIGGSCSVSRYLFDESGKLLRCEQTGEISQYYR